MKAYTSVEQSEKLAEILPIDTADMFYYYVFEPSNRKWQYDKEPTIIGYHAQLDRPDSLPCWSLAVLLELLPKEINVLGTIYSIDIHTNNKKWFIDYKCNNEELIGVYSINLVDAVYEMIVKLKRRNSL